MSAEGIVLFDPAWRNQLLPLAFTRSIADFRIGILTIKEKWKLISGFDPQVLTLPYLQPRYPFQAHSGMLCVNAAVLPDSTFLSEADNLPKGSCLVSSAGEILAARPLGNIEQLEALFRRVDELKKIPASFQPLVLQYCWDLFSYNGSQIRNDILLLGFLPSAEKLSVTNKIIGKENVYVEEGVKAEFSIINATGGPVYLGKGSELMEGALIRGPFALGENAQVKMGSKIYGDTTIGPYCKVGGEISNSVLFGYSNKAHDGFLGNSVLGEWCNLGADTNNSNLKNNYGSVSAYNYDIKDMQDTGLQFCGLIMGDHSKCGINTMFNTGTVVGVSANIYGGGFPPKHIPSFMWGGAAGFEEFLPEKAIEVAKKVTERRQISMSKEDENILRHIFLLTAEDRNIILG